MRPPHEFYVGNTVLIMFAEKSYALSTTILQQRSGWSGPVSRKTWIARLGESASLAAGSLRVQPTSGDGTSSVVKKIRLAVVTTYR